MDCDDYDDYNDYNTPNTRRVDERAVTMNGSTDKQTTSTLRLRENAKQDDLAVLYKHLNVTDDLDLINLNWFNYTKNIRKGNTILEFTMVINGFLWQNGHISCLHQKL